MTNVIIVFLSLLIATILLAQFTLRYIYDYQISDIGIEIVLFGKFPIKHIPFNNIEEIRKLTFKETLPFKSIEMFSALRFGNRVWGQSLSIRQKKGIIKIVLITPGNTDGFLEEVQKKIGRG